MRVIETIGELMAERAVRGAGDTGFVPTMGALHQGHLSLIRRAQAENARTWASIFVNPSQFNDPADLAAYPRPMQEDLAALREAGVDLVFAPSPREMYPDGYRYRVSEVELSRQYCGAGRPGHFDGVLTVVMKLLALTRPQRAYFGAKDFQQLQLIRGMVEAFFLEVEIVPCALVREPDGLAASSRNRRLDATQRALAPSLHRLLVRSTTAQQSADELTAALTQAGFAVEYVADFGGRRLVAARLGQVRLIDNAEHP